MTFARISPERYKYLSFILITYFCISLILGIYPFKESIMTRLRIFENNVLNYVIIIMALILPIVVMYSGYIYTFVDTLGFCAEPISMVLEAE